MTWKMMCNLLEATDNVIPTRQISMISKAMENFEDRPSLIQIISMEYPSNNLGASRLKKWVAKAFDVHDDEVDDYLVIYDELGEAVYYFDSSAESDSELSLNQVIALLSYQYSGIDSHGNELFESAFSDMSALERKWFIRYLLRTPRNGMSEGTTKKILAKHYGKTQATVKKHTSFNTLHNTCNYYERQEEPPLLITHGSFISPMLAKQIPQRKWPTDRIVDYKYDGNRYQIHRSGNNVIIFNRKGNVVTNQYPDIVEKVRTYSCDEFIFDGEIYPVKEDGSPAPHQVLGTRVHSKNHEEAVRKCPVRWVIFDCLKINGETTMDLSYRERIAKMENVEDQAHRITEGDPIAFYHQAIADGFEGIIVKDASASYQAGKRSVSWAKHKPPRIELDLVIMGATYGEGKRAGVFGSYLMGARSDKGWTEVCWVGTGLSDSDLVRLTNDLRKNVDSFKNGQYSFLPRIVLEISADIITRDSEGNLSLRFPRVNRIRTDKFAADANTFEDILEMI